MEHSGIWQRITEIIMAIGGFFVGLYGGWSPALSILVVFMAADYILGVACALAKKSTKTEGGGFLSKVAFMGLLKKGVIMLVVLLAVQLDKALAGNSETIVRTFERGPEHRRKRRAHRRARAEGAEGRAGGAAGQARR